MSERSSIHAVELRIPSLMVFVWEAERKQRHMSSVDGNHRNMLGTMVEPVGRKHESWPLSSPITVS